MNALTTEVRNIQNPGSWSRGWTALALLLAATRWPPTRLTILAPTTFNFSRIAHHASAEQTETFSGSKHH